MSINMFLFTSTAVLFGLAPSTGLAASDAVTPAEVEAVASNEEMPVPAKLVVDESAVSVASATASGSAAEAPSAPAAPSKDEVAKLPESEIPVLTGAKQSKRAEGGGISRILATLGVLTVVIGGAFFALKRWGRGGGVGVKSPKIQVLTQHALGPKKSLAIIQVAGESILIGVTDHNISMLKTLALIDDEVPETVPANFGNALSEFEEEDFAVKGLSEIRDKVSTRLKTMRSL